VGTNAKAFMDRCGSRVAGSATPRSCIAPQHLARNCSQGGSEGNPTTLSSSLPLYGCVSGVRAEHRHPGDGFQRIFLTILEKKANNFRVLFEFLLYL